MANFVKLAATAKRLINANGRLVVIVKQTKDPQNSDQPWRGQGLFDTGLVSGKAVFVNSSDLGYSVRDESNVKRAAKVALFAASNDDGELLETFDLIREGLIEWKIVKAEVLEPADTRLLYMFEVER